MAKYSFHQDHILPENGEVFVFGSNLAAIHGAGAALVATQRFGASRSVPVGYSHSAASTHSHSYAIPTKDDRIKTLPLEIIKIHVQHFLHEASHGQISNFNFFITRVGCGLAGYKDMQIAPMFRGATINCIFPIEWKEYL